MKSTSQLRIIGGQWRGRKLHFPAVVGLRPTPDRVRETLFNWLAPTIEDARCLDLFAGSGALGIEALSRGAASSVFIENNQKINQFLQQNLTVLKAEHSTVITSDALKWLSGAAAQSFDIVFLDPPFGQNLLQPICQTLEQNNYLSNKAWIYLESEPNLTLLLPANWCISKDKTAGQVRYRLAQRS